MKQIQLTQGRVALIDDEDFEQVNKFKWCFTIQGYAVRGVGGRKNHRKMYMHRFITNCPFGMEIDHRDGNKLNNQKCNLRICTPTQNKRNIKKQSNNKAGYKGVSYFGNKYIRATISINRKQIHLGFFPDLITAAKAYDKKAKELFGEFAYLNFPEEV